MKREGRGLDCKSMELEAAGWCTRKWQRLGQTVRILTSGDLGVIRLGVTVFVYGVNQENLEAGVVQEPQHQ